MKNKKIVVSVICNTYNQVKYIRDALEGMVSQKTTFDYEILVHDDASNDGTTEIIKEFALKYPDLVYPVYQEKNQYSQGVSITKVYQYPRARGDYIALCEGDDYWIDELKLEKQYREMRKNPTVAISAHAASSVRAETKEILNIIAPCRKTCIIPTEKIIMGLWGDVATCSLMYKKEAVVPISPLLEYKHFDYTIRLQGAITGGMLYIDELMSSYRVQADGSWTQRRVNNNESIIRHQKELISLLEVFDKQTDFKYKKVVKKKIEKLETEIIIKTNVKENELLEYIVCLKKLSVKQMTIVILIIIKRAFHKVRKKIIKPIQFKKYQI